MNLWKEIPTGPSVPDVIYSVIEIPKGSRNKYEYNKDMEAFSLIGVLNSHFIYPIDSGMIPQTLSDDGDPLDVLVLIDQPTFPGCIIETRPIGIMRMIDCGECDDKILGVPVNDPRYNHIKNIDNITDSVLYEIESFFNEYKMSEGKKTEVLKWESAENAYKAIKNSMDVYRKEVLY